MRLQISPKTVTRLGDRGDLGPSWLTDGGHRRYTIEGVEAYETARGAA